MNSDMKVGLGAAALMALCCGGPLILALLASGAAAGTLGAVWSYGRGPLIVGAIVVLVAGIWLAARRRARIASEREDCCALPEQAYMPTDVGAPEASRSPERAVAAGQRTT
jgi:hypothetical protein